VDWDRYRPGAWAKEELPDYRGWKVWDMGESHHPAGDRFRAMLSGVGASGRTLEQLKKSIDYRIQQYPGSGGA